MLDYRTSVIFTSVFAVALLSSTVISGASTFYVTATIANNSRTSFSVHILPPSVVKVKDIQETDPVSSNAQTLASYTVQVVRQNKAGQFSVMLSTVSDTRILNGLKTFNPSPVVYFEQGQTVKNVTLTIASRGVVVGEGGHQLTPGAYKFQVKAVSSRNSLGDGSVTTDTANSRPNEALSNLAALVVVDSGSSLSSLSEGQKQTSQPYTDSQSQKQLVNPTVPPTPNPPSKSSQQLREQQQKLQENHPPIAKAGLDQQVDEGEIVTLDASASNDPDKLDQHRLSYLWEKTSSTSNSGSHGAVQYPLTINKANNSSSKAFFKAPNVKEDTIFTLRLTVWDKNGAKATDSVSILVKNIATPLATARY